MARQLNVMVLFLFTSISTISALVPLKNEHRDQNQIDYRLPQIFNPINYNISLVIPVMLSSTSTFTGNVIINFTVLEPTYFVKLHASHTFLTLKNVTLNEVLLEPTYYSTDADTDIVTIDYSTIGQLEPSLNHTLNITFNGTVNDNESFGFYKSLYVGIRNRSHYVGVTEFAPVYARTLFPCFDEPSMKATFDVAITAGYRFTVFFNTPVVNTNSSPALTVTTSIFEQTPKMSTYHLGLVISDFGCGSSKNNTEGNLVPFRVCSRTSSNDSDRNWAIEVGPKLLRALNSYTEYDHTVKMDLLAIPDFNFGSMSSWGIGTYREDALLWNPDDSSNVYKQTVTTTIANQLTHQWFGNLVTSKWWSETFINEGLSTYFAYFISHEVLGTWEFDKQFVVDHVQKAMALDHSENSQALQSNCSSHSEIFKKFGKISESKGASIIRMVSHIMGQDNFKSGLQSYISQMSYKNVEPDDLWDILQESVDQSYSKLLNRSDLKTVMKNWVTLSGYPLLTATLKGSTLKISQEPYGSMSTSKWFVPITYSESTGTSDMFDSTMPQAWMSESGETLSIDLPNGVDWILLNNLETGYYRVNYDNTTWSNIAMALKAENFSGIPDLHRAQIVDDAFNLAKIGKIKYIKAFEILEFLSNDTSYYSWVSAFNGLEHLLLSVGTSSDLRKKLVTHIQQLMQNVFDSVPLTKVDPNDQIYTLKQTLVYSWACISGNQDCLKQVIGLFKEYQSTGTKINPNLRLLSYCTAMRESTDPEDWDFLWDKYNGSYLNTEQSTILTALGCSKDRDKLKYYLNLTISEHSGIRSQDASIAFASVYNGNAENLDIALDFLIDNHKIVTKKYAMHNFVDPLVNLIDGISVKFTNVTQIQKLKTLLEKNADLSDESQTTINQAIKKAEKHLEWTIKLKEELTAYYSGQHGGATHIKLSILLLILSIIFSFNM